MNKQLNILKLYPYVAESSALSTLLTYNDLNLKQVLVELADMSFWLMEDNTDYSTSNINEYNIYRYYVSFVRGEIIAYVYLNNDKAIAFNLPHDVICITRTLGVFMDDYLKKN